MGSRSVTLRGLSRSIAGSRVWWPGPGRDPEVAGETARGAAEDSAKFSTIPPPGETGLARLAGGRAKEPA